VLTHQSALWAYLFGGAARPNVDLAGNASDRGKQLFDQFRQAVRTGPSVLIPDPWEDTPPLLPNDHERGDWTLGFDAMYPNFLDPTSLSTAVESEGSLLSDIVFRLEKLSIGNYWPYRRGP
jgi:hypothetical protein